MWKHNWPRGTTRIFFIFLPWAVTLAWLLLVSALAQSRPQSETEESGSACSSNVHYTAEKRLYLGLYTDLDWLQRIRLMVAPVVNPERLNHAAIAYTYEPRKLLGGASRTRCWPELLALILVGKIAFAQQNDTSWMIVSSADILDNLGDEPTVWSSESPPDNWLDAWRLATRTSPAIRGSNHLNDELATILLSKETRSDEDDLPSGLLILGIEDNMFGIPRSGRIITWNGARQLPAMTISALAAPP